MTALRHALVLARKDLRIEARGRQTIGLMVVLGVLIVVVLALGIGGGSGRPVGGAAATAILWVAYFFGGMLCFEQTMAVERHDDALAGLLLAPIDRGAIFLGKLIANLALMLGLALVVTPAGIVLFQLDLSGAPLGFAAVITLGMLGFAAIGTLFAAAVSTARPRGGLLPMLVLPLSLPLVITSTQLTLRMFDDLPSANTGGGLGLLVAFDAVFLVASWLAFELVLEP
jgi:heme exporter protein B